MSEAEFFNNRCPKQPQSEATNFGSDKRRKCTMIVTNSMVISYIKKLNSSNILFKLVNRMVLNKIDLEINSVKALQRH